MNYSITIRAAAARDIEEAATWYESQREGLGGAFARVIDEAIHLASAAPTTFPLVHRSIRRVLAKRFPFGIYYHVNEAEQVIVIMAVMHLRRHPAQWQRRR